MFYKGDLNVYITGLSILISLFIFDIMALLPIA